MHPEAQKNIEAAMSFVKAVEQLDGSQMDDFFSPDVKQIEWPNLFKTEGQERDLSSLKADIEKAAGILEGQRYEITKSMADENSVMLEMIWRGVMATDLSPLTSGQKLRAHCVAIFDFSDGMVTGLRNYDCFDPLPVKQA